MDVSSFFDQFILHEQSVIREFALLDDLEKIFKENQENLISLRKKAEENPNLYEQLKGKIEEKFLICEKISKQKISVVLNLIQTIENRVIDIKDFQTITEEKEIRNDFNLQEIEVKNSNLENSIKTNEFKNQNNFSKEMNKSKTEKISSQNQIEKDQEEKMENIMLVEKTYHTRNSRSNSKTKNSISKEDNFGNGKNIKNKKNEKRKENSRSKEEIGEEKQIKTRRLRNDSSRKKNINLNLNLNLNEIQIENENQNENLNQNLNENQNEDENEDQEISCFCGMPNYGEMVACDNPDCEYGWFHFGCVGLTQIPQTEKWFCPFCTRKKKEL